MGLFKDGIGCLQPQRGDMFIAYGGPHTLKPQRGDMCHLSESQIARMITPISSGGLAFKIAH